MQAGSYLMKHHMLTNAQLVRKLLLARIKVEILVLNFLKVLKTNNNPLLKNSVGGNYF